MAKQTINFQIKDIKYDWTMTPRQIMGEPMLKAIGSVTKSCYGNVVAKNSKKYSSIKNQNYYEHIELDNKGIARGAVACGHTGTWYAERKHHYLQKALFEARL